MQRVPASDHYRQMEGEIWAGDDDEADSIDAMRPHPITGAIQSLKDSQAELMKSAEGMSASQKAMAEGLVGVLADVVGIIRESHDGLKEAVQTSAAHELAKELKAVRETMAADAKRNQQVLASMTMTMERMGQRLDDMVAAMTAPRNLIMNDEGMPVGVRIGS